MCQTESKHEQEVSNEGQFTSPHTTEHVLDPTVKCFQSAGTSKEPPLLLPQASLLNYGMEQPNIIQSMTKLLQAQTFLPKHMQLLYRVYHLSPISLDKMWTQLLMKTALIDG